MRNELLYPTASGLFFEAEGHSYAKDTISVYRSFYRRLQTANPGKRMSEFRETDLVAWITGDERSPSTQLQRRNALVALFSWAHGEGLCQRDPSVRLRKKVNPRNYGVRQHNWLGKAEISTVLAVCDDGTDIGRRDRAILSTGFSTGIRAAELAALRWGAIDLPGKRLFIVGKGSKPDQKGFTKEMAEILMEWRGRCAVGLGRPPMAKDPVFPRGQRLAFGGDARIELLWAVPLGHGGIRGVFARRGAEAGMPSLRPHDGRRSFIAMVEKQWDLLTASKAAGHSNVGTTQIYLQKDPRKHVQAGQELDIAL